jgi:hypothetical protein
MSTALNRQKASAARLLPREMMVHEAAERCRVALLEFLAGINGGWGRADLGAWLQGSYRHATTLWSSAVPFSTRKTFMPGGGRPLGEDTMEGLLLHARREIIAMLEACKSSWESSNFARELSVRRVIVQVKDDSGGLGWAPVDSMELSLVDRVAALLAADYMTRPADYRSLIICEDCGHVSFEWAPLHASSCEAPHRYHSAVVARDRETPSLSILPLPPRDEDPEEEAPPGSGGYIELFLLRGDRHRR